MLNTSMVECRFSVLGITIIIWGSIPHNSTQDHLVLCFFVGFRFYGMELLEGLFLDFL